MSSIKPRVFTTRKLIPAHCSILQERCDVSSWENPEPIPRDELLRRVVGVEALMCLPWDNVDKELLDAAGPNLRVVCTTSVGYNHLDLEELRSRGIRVGYTPDVITDAMVELTVALTIMTARKLMEYNDAILSGTWHVDADVLWMCGMGLGGSTVGIIGLGRIGLGVSRALAGFNVSRILYTGPREKPEEARLVGAEFTTMDELLARSDFVIVTCALTAATRHMFDYEAFCKMKKTAVFVNTSRGGVVDQDDLVRALKEKKICACGLDVMTPEPLPADHDLIKMKNCVLLPHVGTATVKARTDMLQLAVDNLLAGLRGEPMPAKLC